MIHTRSREKGFALPTILIASVVMLIVLISAVSAANSVRQALNDQYYNQLAREAAESGLARAIACYRANGGAAQWNNGSPLRPNTSCTGGASCTNAASCFVVQQSDLRSTFQVSGAFTQGSSQLFRSYGSVTLLRASTGTSWRSYHVDATVRLDSGEILDPIIFGP